MTEATPEQVVEFMTNVMKSTPEQIITMLRAEIERLTAQLPEDMKHCTIEFKQCEKGHGRLTATNWIDHGCPHCENVKLKAISARAAGFLQGMADRIEGWACTRSEVEEFANFDRAAQDCRTMAASLKKNMVD